MQIDASPAILVPLMLAACTAPAPHESMRGHLSAASNQPNDIFAPPVRVPPPPATPIAAKPETYNIVVNNRSYVGCDCSF
jgi:hypothetical protein